MGGKTGSICHFAFALALQHLEVPTHPDATLLCAPNASKNWDLRAVSPYAGRQSTGKMANRPHFAHILGNAFVAHGPRHGL